MLILPLFQDIALALCALASIVLVGVGILRIFRAPFSGLELLAFGAGLGVLIHGLIGLAVALSPAKQTTARVLFLVIWTAAALGLRRRSVGNDLRAGSFRWRNSGVRPTLIITGLFILTCLTWTHLRIRFPRVLPDGCYIYKEHTLPVKLQVLTGGLPMDNYLPFVVQEFLLRDISFAREHPLLPGQEVSNRPILMALVTAPFRAAIKAPPRHEKPLYRFRYIEKEWPDVSEFMQGSGFRRFLAVGIMLNALVLVGAALVIAVHGPRTLLVPGLLLLATSPFYLSQTIFTWPKCLAAFLILLALHALTSGKNSILVALAGALAYYSHPLAVVFLFGFGCHYAAIAIWKRQRREFEAFVRYGATVLLMLVPWFIWTLIVLRIPSDLFAQNFITQGVASIAAHIAIRLVTLSRAFGPEMLMMGMASPFSAQRLFYHSLICLPGILGLLVLPAYAACVLCLRTHRVFIVYGIVLPAVLLSIPFTNDTVPIALVSFQSIAICLLLLALILIARAGRAVAMAVIAAQIGLQLALLGVYGRALGATFSRGNVVYRLLDHHPEVRDARYQVNFHVDVGIADDHAEVIWSQPPASVIYRGIHLPSGVTHFRGRIAIHPLVWDQSAADGAKFALEIRSYGENELTPSQRVWSFDVDPFHHPEQRTWLPVDVDLSTFAGKTVDLILKNEAGPVNNDYADWCVWADPQLVRIGESSSH
jgi:hypothetical protein